MKVLLVHNFYRITGGECHAVRAQQALLESRGVEVIPLFRDNAEVFSAGGIEKVRAALRARRNRIAIAELKEQVRAHRPDVAHVHNVLPMISPGIYDALRMLGVPVVQSVHNLRLRCPGGLMYRDGQVCDECLQTGMHRAVVNRCVQNRYLPSALYADAISSAWRRGSFKHSIDRYIVFNEHFAKQMVAFGIDRDSLDLLPNFVETPYDTPASKKPYALFLGRLSPEKGLDVLLDAWTRVHGIKLLVAGSGELQGELERRAGTDLAGRVEFIGYVGGERKQRLLREASLSVLPSRWHENCPLSLLESLAAGTAVVASRMGGLPDMVRDDETGILVPAGDARALSDAINRYVHEPGLATKHGMAALRDARHRFSSEAHYRGLMSIYASVGCSQPVSHLAGGAVDVS